MVFLYTSIQICLVLVHCFKIWKNRLSSAISPNLTKRLKRNTNFRCFREISKPYLTSLSDLNTVNTANHKRQLHKHCKYQNKDHKHLPSNIEWVTCSEYFGLGEARIIHFAQKLNDENVVVYACCCGNWTCLYNTHVNKIL